MLHEWKLLLAAMMGAGFVFVGLGQVHPLWGLVLAAGLLALCWLREERPTSQATGKEWDRPAKVVDFTGVQTREQVLLRMTEMCAMVWEATGVQTPTLLSVSVLFSDGLFGLQTASDLRADVPRTELGRLKLVATHVATLAAAAERQQRLTETSPN